MMTRTLLARCATLAIVAPVALPAVPAVAQDSVTVEPVIVLPEPVVAAPVTATPAPAPSIVLPEAVVTPEPRVAPAEPVAPAVAQRTMRAAAPRSAVRASAPTAPAAIAAPEAETASVPPSPVVVAASPSTPEMSPQAAPRNSDNTGEIALAALLGALGLAAVGGIAFAASRRRRRDTTVDREPLAYASTPEPAEAPAPLATIDYEPAPVSSASAPVAVANARTISPRGSGDPVALPEEMPDTYEERDALLKELVAAPADKANPFTSPRARARRAKLILQSLGRSFQSRKPRIDLSEYTNRWPALRGWQPATA